MKKLALCIGLLLGIGGITSAFALDARALFKASRDSVVFIGIFDAKDKIIGLGSGFFVADGKSVATNYHVIKQGFKVRVQFRADEGVVITQDITHVLGLDTEHDLALLYTPYAGNPLKLAERAPEVGEEIMAIGNPKALAQTLSTGIVSGIRQAEGATYYQMTTPISPGSSGGPVLDAHGKVLGVSKGFIEKGQNLNFAVPASYLQQLLRNPTKTPINEARQAAHERLAAAKRQSVSRPTQPSAPVTGASAYRVGIFPFTGRFARTNCEARETEITAMVRGLIQSNDSLQLTYSYYDKSLNEPPIKKPDKLWRDKKPNVELAYKLGRERNVDAIVMFRGDSVSGYYCTDEMPPFPVALYVLDVSRRHTYHRKGYEANLKAMTKQAFSRFLAGRPQVVATAPPAGTATSPTPAAPVKDTAPETLSPHPDTAEDQHKRSGYMIRHTAKHGVRAPFDKAVVYVVRPQSWGTLIRMWAFVDDRLIGVTKGKTYTYALVEPGEHLFWAKATLNVHGIKLTVEAGETYYLQQRVWGGLATAEVRLVRLDEASAQALFYDCTYVSPGQKAIAKAPELIDKYYTPTQGQTEAESFPFQY